MAKVVMPDVAAQFRCTADGCEDNCCRSSTWDIEIDREIYERYKAVGGETGELLLDGIEEKGGRLTAKGAEDGQCRFLDPGGLCVIQSRLGAEYLSRTCKTYPRSGGGFNGAYEYHLGLSCPEAARRVLFSRRGIGFIEAGQETSPEPTQPHEAEAHRLRAVMLGILMYRRFSLMDKLAYIGMLAQSADRLARGESFPRAVEELAAAYLDNLKNPQILSGFHEVRRGVDKAARDGLLRQIFEIAPASVRIPQVPGQVANHRLYELASELRLAAATEAGLAEMPEAYYRLAVPYVNANAYVFENYLAYEMFALKFPRGAESIAESYKRLTGELLVLLALAAGIYRREDSIGDEEIKNAVYLFHRAVSHDKRHRDRLGEVFDGCGLGVVLGAFGAVD